MPETPLTSDHAEITDTLIAPCDANLQQLLRSTTRMRMGSEALETKARCAEILLWEKWQVSEMLVGWLKGYVALVLGFFAVFFAQFVIAFVLIGFGSGAILVLEMIFGDWGRRIAIIVIFPIGSLLCIWYFHSCFLPALFKLVRIGGLLGLRVGPATPQQVRDVLWTYSRIILGDIQSIVRRHDDA